MKHLSILAAVTGLAAQTVLGASPKVPKVHTTSGILQGSEQYGVLSFKGVPYGQAPVGTLRWAPPRPFVSTASRNATVFGPSCIQQIPLGPQNLTTAFFDNGQLESEDCLFLNVWTPSHSGHKKPVAFWIHGGGLAMGTASTPLYDGLRNEPRHHQDIVVVRINYRTNVFGFPGAEELFPTSENLGFLDQDLALQWVQDNIEAFGGDPDKVTIFGQSAGGWSVAHAIQRHSRNPPFRAAIIQSGSIASISPTPNFSRFDALTRGVNCTQTPGVERLACMKAIPADVIHTWINGPNSSTFLPVIDNATVFPHPFQRIQQKKTARVPVMAGVVQDDGTFAAAFIQAPLPDVLSNILNIPVAADEVRAVYPGLNDSQIISVVIRDFLFLCPTALTANALVRSGMKDVFRYIYGAVFEDLQVFPGAGAWHASEIGEVFGTFNASTASPSEVTLSGTMQTIWGNFMKNPTVSPANNWHRYDPGNGTQTLARLAYDGNVELMNVVQAAPSALDDGPCEKLWNQFIVI